MTDDEDERLARGSTRIERLARDRAGFVEFQQTVARQALSLGHVGAARAALRVLRADDFQPALFGMASQLLGVLRDHAATDAEVADAVTRLTVLQPEV